MNIDMERVRPEVVDRYLNKHYGVDPVSGTIEERVAKLAEFQKKVPPKHVADCNFCGAESDVRLDSCPFCGVGDDENDSRLKEEGMTSRKKAAVKKTADWPVVKITKEGEKNLDAAVEAVNVAKAAVVGGYWELGNKLFAIYEKRLYTQRADTDGLPKYKNWNQFVQAELNMSAAHSYKIMDIAVSFQKKDIDSLGVAKLGVILQLRDGERKKMVDKAKKDGMTFSEVAKEVRAKATGTHRESTLASKAGRKGFKGGSAGSTKGSKARAKPTPPKPKKGQVTAIVTIGRTTVPLYARPKKDGDRPKRANQLAQDPFGFERNLDGVKVEYRVVRQSKGLALVIERTREEK